MRCSVLSILLLFSFRALAQKPKKGFTCSVPITATFSEGNNSLHQFIDQNFVQPDTVPDSTFCKKGKVKFVIDKNGMAVKFEIMEFLGYDCDEEIIRILKLTKWKPAFFDGNKIDDIRIFPHTIMFEKSEAVNSDTFPQSAPACPLQMPLAKYVL